MVTCSAGRAQGANWAPPNYLLPGALLLLPVLNPHGSQPRCHGGRSLSEQQAGETSGPRGRHLRKSVKRGDGQGGSFQSLKVGFSLGPPIPLLHVPSSLPAGEENLQKSGLGAFWDAGRKVRETIGGRFPPP